MSRSLNNSNLKIPQPDPMKPSPNVSHLSNHLKVPQPDPNNPSLSFSHLSHLKLPQPDPVNPSLNVSHLSNHLKLPPSIKPSPNVSGLHSSNSFQNLGNSIVSSKNINSFTVNKVKDNSIANSFTSKQPKDVPLNINSFTSKRPIIETSQNINSFTGKQPKDTPLNINSFTNRQPKDSSFNLNSFTNKKIKENSYVSNTSRMLNPQHLTPQSTPKSMQRSPSIVANTNQYLKRKIDPQRPPADLKFSVFAIYESGNGYDKGRRTYGMPKGMGVLINESLCLTAASVFKDESDVINSFMQLKDGSIFKFDPYRAFTSLEGQFAIAAFRLAEVKILETFKPIDIRKPFELAENDPVFYFPFDSTQNKLVSTVSSEEFTISSGRVEFMLPGNPIFTMDWVLQGIFLSSEGHINKILKVSTVMESLNQSIYLVHNPLLEKFTRQHEEEYVEKFHGRYLYYFEWGTTSIWRYDLDSKGWSNVKIHNLEEFTRQNTLWTFGVNSRLVFLPDKSIFCIGGHSINTNIELRDMVSFRPQEFQTLHMMAEMNVPRSGPACVYCNNYVYVFGGKPHPKTCEKYSIASNKWIPLASMYYPRTDSTASAALSSEYIFLIGGEPFSPSGTAIEKYSIKFNHWELLNVYLPKPMSKIGIFPITNRRIALIGGTESSHIFILNINEVLEFEGVNYSYDVENVTYSLQDCYRPLEYVTETVFPVAYCRTENKLFIMNSYKADPNALSFTIEEFSVEYFDISSSVDYTQKPNELIAKVRTPYDLGRTWKNDEKLRMIK